MASFGSNAQGGGDDDLFGYATNGPPPTEAASEAASDDFTTNAEDQAAAAAMRTGAGSSSSSSSTTTTTTTGGELFPEVKIDEGTFKYVLIEAMDPAAVAAAAARGDPGVEGGEGTRLLVRGHVGASYHRDAARATTELLTAAAWPFEVLGGGRIRHDAAAKTILVYGHSYGFPWGDEGSRHADAVEVLKRAFPDYESITWTDEGY